MRGTNIISAISEIFIFKGMSKEKLSSLSKIVIKKTYGKGEIIFEAGSPASGFYAVSNGRIKIYQTSPSGKEQIINIFGPGENFGEVPVFQGSTFPVNAQTLEASALFYIPRQEFAHMIAGDPDLAMTIMAQLSSRLRTLINKIEELSLKEAPARVAAYLLLLAETNHSATFTLDMPKGQIAYYLGTIQETLSRIFKRFVEDEVIMMKGKEITLLDQQTLYKMAGQGKWK